MKQTETTEKPRTIDDVFAELSAIRRDQQAIAKSLAHIIEALAELTMLEDEAAGIDIEACRQNAEPDRAYQ